MESSQTIKFDALVDARGQLMYYLFVSLWKTQPESMIHRINWKIFSVMKETFHQYDNGKEAESFLSHTGVSGELNDPKGNNSLMCSFLKSVANEYKKELVCLLQGFSPFSLIYRAFITGETCIHRNWQQMIFGGWWWWDEQFSTPYLRYVLHFHSVVRIRFSGYFASILDLVIS